MRRYFLSGVSLAAFCRLEGLAYQSVLAWRKAARGEVLLKERGCTKGNPAFLNPAFLEVVCEQEEGKAKESGAKRGFGGVSGGELGLGALRPGLGSVRRASSVLVAELSLPGGLCLRVFSADASQGQGNATDAVSINSSSNAQ